MIHYNTIRLITVHCLRYVLYLEVLGTCYFYAFMWSGAITPTSFCHWYYVWNYWKNSGSSLEPFEYTFYIPATMVPCEPCGYHARLMFKRFCVCPQPPVPECHVYQIHLRHWMMYKIIMLWEVFATAEYPKSWNYVHTEVLSAITHCRKGSRKMAT